MFLNQEHLENKKYWSIEIRKSVKNIIVELECKIYNALDTQCFQHEVSNSGAFLIIYKLHPCKLTNELMYTCYIRAKLEF